MTLFLGIDLGTSSLKAVVINDHGQLLGVGSQEYPIQTPRPSWAEQDPQTWWEAAVMAVGQATRQIDPSAISAIGLTGQMHGTVLIGSDLEALGSAIIWADQRSLAEVAEMTGSIGSKNLAAIAGTAPATGFMGPTLLWLRRHKPRRLEQAKTVLLPKDYLRLRLTGNIATEASDASSTALFDLRQRKWSQEIVKKVKLPLDILPPVLDSAAIAGQLTEGAAKSLGLPLKIPVVAGCADQVAQAVGNGLLDPGHGSITIGSGGQVFTPLDQPRHDEALRVHTFCHAPVDRWYLMGAMLTAGLSLRWFRDLLGITGVADAYQQLTALAQDVSPGADGLLFLPYLLGERSPLMDPQARGGFIGLTLSHQRGHIARSIMEGVAFALRQILETIQALDAPVNITSARGLLAVGNGLRSPVWRQIVANVLAQPLYLPVGHENTAVGAALVAGIGVKHYADYHDLKQVIPSPQAGTEPVSAPVEFYEMQYQHFCKMYPLLKNTGVFTT